MALFAFRQVQQLGRTPGPHVRLRPHPPAAPAVRARRGRPAHPRGGGRSSRPEAELFAEQLDYTNDLIRQTVEALLAGPDESDPIIVITADEGPYLCGDVDCVDGTPETYGIRLGVLRAYYLPGLDVEVPADDTGVNIFRILFREYFGADLPDLPNRSYTWPDNDHLYDFRDITDLLPLPGGPGYRPPSEDHTIHTGEATPRHPAGHGRRPAAASGAPRLILAGQRMAASCRGPAASAARQRAAHAPGADGDQHVA